MRCSLVDGLGIGLGVDVGVRRLVWVLRAAAAGLWWECGGRGGVWECGYVVVWDGDGRGRWGGGEAGRRVESVGVWRGDVCLSVGQGGEGRREGRGFWDGVCGMRVFCVCCGGLVWLSRDEEGCWMLVRPTDR